MKLISIEKIGENCYSLQYKPLLSKIKRRNLFIYFYDARWSNNGKKLPYELSISINDKIKDMKINQIFYF